MLPIAMLGFVCTSPGQTFGVSVFNTSFRDALNLTDTKLSAAYMFGTLLASLSMPLVGHLMDRHGLRRTMTGVVSLFGLACIFTSQVTGLVMLFFAFLFLRMLGQGALGLLSGNTLAFWFNRRLGLASGLCHFGFAAAFGLVPALNLWLIHRVGWRWAYAVLGMGVWAILLPLLATLFRNRPEDVGQVPDGGPPPARDGLNDPAVEPDFTVREAARTGLFWVMALSGASWGMIGTGLIFHIQRIFGMFELGAAHVAAMYTALGIALAATQLIGGALADRVPLRFLLAASLTGMIGALSLLRFGAGWWLPYAFGCLVGTSQGLIMVIGNPIWRRNYGLAHLGKIRGSLATLMVAATSLGPFLVGLARDQFGGYDEILLMFMILPAPLVVCALIVPPPKYPPPGRAAAVARP